MKKTLVITLFTVVVSATAQAQSFSLGPKAGINISNYTGGDIKSKSRVGYHIGGLLNFGIGSVVSFQPEVLLSTQGAKIENNGFRQEFKISYITVPVLLKFKGRSGLFFSLGRNSVLDLLRKSLIKASAILPKTWIYPVLWGLDGNLISGLGLVFGM
jgi:hypothetical protein